MKHFTPFFRSVCVSLSGADFFFFREEENCWWEDLTAHKSRSSGYVNNVTD